MVLIEQVITPSGEEKLNAATSPTVESGSASGSVDAGYNSDGYETASDTALNDTENGEETQNQPKDNQLALDQANDAKLEGNTLFKEGSYEEALLKYEQALQIAQDMATAAELRAICHANRGACFSKQENYKETIKECTKALELNPSYTKALIRRGEAHEKLENYEDSIADMTKILKLDPSYDQARRNIIRLKPLADEKREKMKEEMIGKLKEMGNSILGRFGMSVDNFKTVKDPKTGSYSLSFQR